MTSTDELETGADLGTSTKGTLRLADGAANLTITETTAPRLYHARFRGLIPAIADEDGTVTVRYPRRPHPLARDRGEGAIELSDRLPWDLHVSGPAAHLTATLTGLTLTGLTFDDAIADIALDLPSPTGDVVIRVDGHVRDLRLRRPAGVPVGVRVDGGARGIHIDGEDIGATGRGYRTVPPTGPDRYTLAIGEAADRLTVTH